MKFLKSVVVMAISMIALSASAAITSKATIKIKANQSQRVQTINLYVDDATTDLTDYQDPMVDNNTFYAYAQIGTAAKYSKVKQASINNVTIYFKANTLETNYTMSFSSVLGDIILVNGNDTLIADNDSVYAITCAVNEEITYTVNPAPVYNYTREVANGQWGTICYPEAISEVVGATIYEFSYMSGNQVAADVVTLPLVKGKAYLFLATADAQGFNYADATQATSAVANNGLVGTFVADTFDIGEPYVIIGSSLVPAMPAIVPANRAFIPVLGDIPTQQTPARKGRMIFMIPNTPTAVDEVAAPAMNGKMMINGQLVIMKDGKMYNAMGVEL